MAFIFPIHLFNPRRAQARIVESVVSGGVSLSGEEDVIATDGGGRWEISFDNITLRTPAQIRAWEAWEGHLARGATDCLVPLVSVGHANRPAAGKALMPVSGILANDPLWPTSVAYSSPHIVATVGTTAPLRATALVINVSKGAPLEGGEKFSIGWRAYRIVRKTGLNIYQIEPPLREAVGAGVACNFDWPFVKCRSAPGESWSPSIEYGRRGEVSIRFMENAA